MYIKRILCLAAAILMAAGLSAQQTTETAPELARARELSELEWTALHDIQLHGKKDRRVKALKPMHGMLYSSAGADNRMVPYDVSIYTFLTCLHNPYSLLYTESRNQTFPRSAYGFKYSGSRLGGPWMGTVCTVFSSYMAGFEFQYMSSTHANLCKKGILSRPDEQSAQGVEVFDILWHEGHCRTITAVNRTEDGSVASVEISEAVSPVVRRRTFSASAFDSLMLAKKMVIYRRADVSGQGTPPVYYMPPTIEYNDAICTYAGDRACFKKGEKIVLHCLDFSYKKLELYREGQLIKTIRLKSKMIVDNEDLGIRGNLDLDPGAYAVDLSGLNLDYGKYEAFLVRKSGRSKPTSFEIIDGDIRYEDGKLYFSSHNGIPVFFSRGLYHYIISDKERERGWVKAKEVSGKTNLSVTFQGEYGRIRQKLK